MSNTRNKFSLEVRARAVRMVLENEDDYSSRWAAITSISSKIGYVPQTLSSWIKRKEVDSGTRAGVPADVTDKMKALEREVRELRQANEILRKASAYFAHPFVLWAVVFDIQKSLNWGLWRRSRIRVIA